MVAALVILCGVSFSGKSTLAARLAEAMPATVVSLDAINEERGLHGGDGIPVADWATTNDIARHRTALLLRSGANVVVDDTTSLRFLRDGWRSVADSAGARSLLVWVTVDPAVQRARLESNRRSSARRDVADAVMTEHLAGFESPTADEFAVRVDGTLPIELQVALVAEALA